MASLNFGPGVWSEDMEKYPHDEYHFTFFGYPCRILRQEFGHYCGYVTLPENHPCYNCSEEAIADIEVHGGITSHGKKTLGFDCAHAGDMMPSMALFAPALLSMYPHHYWTFEEVKEELKSFALQLKKKEENH